MALANLIQNCPGITASSVTARDPNFQYSVKSKAESWVNTWGKSYGYSLNTGSSAWKINPLTVQISPTQVKILSDKINADSDLLIKEATLLYTDIAKYSPLKGNQFSINAFILSGDNRFRSKSGKTMLQLMIDNQVMIAAFSAIQTALSGRTTYRF